MSLLKEIERNKANVDTVFSRFMELRKVEVKEHDNYRFFQLLCETIMWIDITNEWFFKNDKEDYTQRRLKETTSINGKDISYENLLLGIRFLFNTIKHNMKITNISKPSINNGFLSIRFVPSDEIDMEDKYKYEFPFKKPYEAYKAYVENEKVMDILRPIVDFLRDYFHEYEEITIS
ncbi:hypothetical protein V2H29_02045 [Lysinibacillus fusiformis]|uniref:hypothetical protein n=1 Tax=Lysinibacillus TaxID=400634 RepID=UPI00232D3EA9|nr:hypothetical protein [Lysinibacillus sp. OF-1]MEE3805727.1 hypothetical protein [Lysinibacillus fusiformis]WCH46569.1 hypothetical protein NV349_15935 [Lysinibacillus sp. OF-1]